MKNFWPKIVFVESNNKIWKYFSNPNGILFNRYVSKRIQFSVWNTI